MNQQCEYKNDGQRITQPGKFEGEPVFVPYLWSLGLEGFSDEDTGTEYRFKFTAKDLADPKLFWAKEIKQWLGRKRRIRLYEDSQGFVHCIH